jgi:hypothetical protein
VAWAVVHREALARLAVDGGGFGNSPTRSQNQQTVTSVLAD